MSSSKKRRRGDSSREVHPPSDIGQEDPQGSFHPCNFCASLILIEQTSHFRFGCHGKCLVCAECFARKVVDECWGSGIQCHKCGTVVEDIQSFTVSLDPESLQPINKQATHRPRGPHPTLDPVRYYKKHYTRPQSLDA